MSEDGFSFLENKSGGNYISSTGVESGRFTGAGAVTSIRSIPRDRDAEWHQTFLANFDFTLPKKLIISIEAASHENPKEVVQIRQSMMNLCSILRKCEKIRCIEVVPQSQTYRLRECEDQFRPPGIPRGSYFVWECENRLLPPSQPKWRHKLSRVKQFRLRLDREPVWCGKLSFLVLEKVPDLALVWLLLDDLDELLG